MILEKAKERQLNVFTVAFGQLPLTGSKTHFPT